MHEYQIIYSTMMCISTCICIDYVWVFMCVCIVYVYMCICSLCVYESINFVYWNTRKARWSNMYVFMYLFSLRMCFVHMCVFVFAYVFIIVNLRCYDCPVHFRNSLSAENSKVFVIVWGCFISTTISICSKIPFQVPVALRMLRTRP